MLAVGLGEHHQLDIGRIALELAEGRHQVVDLINGQGQAEFGIGPLQRGLAAVQQVDHPQRRGRQFGEQSGLSLSPLKHDAFRHPVVQQVGHLLVLAWRQCRLAKKA